MRSESTGREADPATTLAISVASTEPAADLEPAFGRCRCFFLVNDNAEIVEIVENTATAADGGAGAHAVQLLVSHHVSTVLTGRCGATATRALQAAGITAVTGLSGPALAVARAHLGLPAG